MGVKITVNDLPKLRDKVRKFLADTPRVAGRYAVEHTRQNILQRGGQPVNGSLDKFEPRKYEVRSIKGKRILMDSRAMVNAIRITGTGPMNVRFGISDAKIAKYAALQNEGGDQTVTPKMKRFFWAKYAEAGGGVTYNIRSKKMAGGNKNKELSSDARFWKAMALKKTGSKIRIRARRFIGITPDLYKGIARELTAQWNNLKM